MGKTFRVVVCGTKECGKTSIIERAIYNRSGPFPSTIEDIYVSNVDTDRGTTETLRIYDTAGIEPKSPSLKEDLPKHLFPFADGYLLVFGLDDEASFQVVDVIRKEVENQKEHNRDKKDLVIVALGNKKDLTQERKIETVQALNWAAREKVKFFEVSAFDRESLYEPFVYLVSKLNPPPNKNTFTQLTMGRAKQHKQSE